MRCFVGDHSAPNGTRNGLGCRPSGLESRRVGSNAPDGLETYRTSVLGDARNRSPNCLKAQLIDKIKQNTLISKHTYIVCYLLNEIHVFAEHFCGVLRPSIKLNDSFF